MKTTRKTHKRTVDKINQLKNHSVVICALLLLFLFCDFLCILVVFWWKEKDADRNLKPDGVSGASRSLIWGPFMEKRIIVSWRDLRRYGPRSRNDNNPGSLTKPRQRAQGWNVPGWGKPSLRYLYIYIYIYIIL